MSGISNWDTSNVTNMDRMFSGATKFANDLSGWNVQYFKKRPDGFADGVPEGQMVEPLWFRIPEGPLLGIIQCLDGEGDYIEVKITKGTVTIPEGITEVLNWGYVTEEYLEGLTGGV